jgi:polyphosphate kinase
MARRSMQALIEQPKDLTTSAPAHGDVALVEATPVAPTAPAHPDLRAPALYLNRELTWLEFNRRVLHEAQDSRNPLLERVKFLAITASNLDEFFMKRIGGLKQRVGAGSYDPKGWRAAPRRSCHEPQLVAAMVANLQRAKQEPGRQHHSTSLSHSE